LPEGWAIDLSRIGNDLGVGYAIEGSVQQATFSLWINARLFDAQNGVHAWVDASIATTATFLGTG
jgi:TolB-like protein